MLNLRLPFPISANNYWQVVNKRLIKTKQARAFIGEVVYRWMDYKSKGNKSFNKDDNLALSVAVFYPIKKGPDADLDNLCKVLIDAMETAQIFPNDKQFSHIQLTRCHNPHREGFVLVNIKKCGKDFTECSHNFIINGIHK